MLVLSRARNERIMIDGGKVVITVVEIRSDKVRLGIDADRSISIDREEIHTAKQDDLVQLIEDTRRAY